MDVDIWSDIACPWCYVGKRRLEAALESFEHRDQVRVRWHSFELDPKAPAEREGDNADEPRAQVRHDARAGAGDARQDDRRSPPRTGSSSISSVPAAATPSMGTG